MTSLLSLPPSGKSSRSPSFRHRFHTQCCHGSPIHASCKQHTFPSCNSDRTTLRSALSTHHTSSFLSPSDEHIEDGMTADTHRNTSTGLPCHIYYNTRPTHPPPRSCPPPRSSTPHSPNPPKPFSASAISWDPTHRSHCCSTPPSHYSSPPPRCSLALSSRSAPATTLASSIDVPPTEPARPPPTPSPFSPPPPARSPPSSC